MAISQKKYINIVSGVGGTSAVSQRELIARIFSENPVLPNGAVVEFSGGATAALASVGEYFGVTSAEYAFAAQYFGFISKKNKQPNKISFARMTTADDAARVIGTVGASTLTALQSITAGTFDVNLNGVEKAIAGINLSTATSFADVAKLITDALTGEDVAASVTYNANGRFYLESTATGSGNVFTAPTGSVADALGMSAPNGIVSPGADSQTAVQTLSHSVEVSNNFFSFAFLSSVTGQEAEIGQWTHTQNVAYMWSAVSAAATMQALQDAVKGFDGVCLTLDKFAANANFMPMAIIAAIDYTQPNAVVNAMYQQFAGVNPSVTTTTESAQWDAIRVNYYGMTQHAGQPVSFYQNGVLQGSITDIGVFANEAWLKDGFFTDLLNLRLSLDSLPATDTGLGLVMTTLQARIEQAVLNGVINPGKTLNATQKAYITQISNDSQAWLSVQTQGYWYTATIEQYTEDGVEKFKVNYTLIYAKGDSINRIDGSDILI